MLTLMLTWVANVIEKLKKSRHPSWPWDQTRLPRDHLATKTFVQVSLKACLIVLLSTLSKRPFSANLVLLLFQFGRNQIFGMCFFDSSLKLLAQITLQNIICKGAFVLDCWIWLDVFYKFKRWRFSLKGSKDFKTLMTNNPFLSPMWWWWVIRLRTDGAEECLIHHLRSAGPCRHQPMAFAPYRGF